MNERIHVDDLLATKILTDFLEAALVYAEVERRAIAADEGDPLEVPFDHHEFEEVLHRLADVAMGAADLISVPRVGILGSIQEELRGRSP